MINLEFQDWLKELGGRFCSGVYVFDSPVPLFVIAGALLPEHIREAVIFEGQETEYIEQCIFELLGDAIVLRELLTIEIDEPYCPSEERRLLLCSTQEFAAAFVQSTEIEQLTLLMAVAVGPEVSVLDALRSTELANGIWTRPAGSVTRVINRSHGLISDTRATQLAAWLTGSTVAESLVI